MSWIPDGMRPLTHAARGRLRSAIGFVVACALTTAPVAASSHGWDTASDIGRNALVAAALGVPAIQEDWSGDLQAGGSVLLAHGAAYGLKRLFPEERPDRSDRHSFPSGHTTMSFAAAATLENRYGWKAGLPAFLVASFVSISRVQARKHHWHDVVAGAAIGTGSGLLVTSKRSAVTRLVPFVGARGGGIALATRF